jgi:hypothetical protein
METAKVDIRKLQVLNDSINRTIEALNQVRLSVHGVQSIGGIGSPLGTYPGAFASPYAIAPQLMGQLQGQLPGLVPGIAHSAQNPWASLVQFPNLAAQWQAAAQWPNVAQAAQAAQAAAQAAAWGMNPLTQWTQNGLGHTAADNRWDYANYTNYADPYTTARIAQTFPFVHWGYSPFAWPTV